MRKLRRVTLGVLMLLVGLPAAAPAQSTQMQPQRPGVGSGQTAPAQRPGAELQRRPGEAPPPSQGVPGPSQPPQGWIRPEEQRHWAGGGWSSGPRYSYYPYYGYNPYAPYDPYYPYYGPPAGYRPPAVWVPPQWEWNGWGWVWQPGYWRY